MEQVTNSILGMLTVANPAQADRSAAVKSKAEDDFQTLLDKHSGETKGAENRKDPKEPSAKGEEKTQEAPKAEKPAKEGDDAEQTEDVAVQAQAMWAAMSVMNPPVVQAEPEQEPQLVDGAAEMVMAVAEEPAQQAAVQTAPQEQAQAGDAELFARQTGVQAADKQVSNTELKPEVELEPEVKAEAVQTQVTETPGDSEDIEVKTELTENTAEPVFHEVESAPIKVGEAKPTEETAQAKPVENQVAEPVIQALGNGESRVQISLTPENLGTVRVELIHTGDGALRVVLSADNAETRGLLEKNAAGLQSLLAKNDHEIVEVQVERQQESQQNGGYNRQQEENGREQQSGEQHRENRGQHSSQDFLQQLRLGLVPVEEVS